VYICVFFDEKAPLCPDTCTFFVWDRSIFFCRVVTTRNDQQGGPFSLIVFFFSLQDCLEQWLTAVQ